jgi:hypothetical protein
MRTVTTTEAPISEEKKTADPVCCPEFSQKRFESFQETLITFDEKPFVKDRIWCFFYIPLNFDSVLTRTSKKIEAAKADVPDDDLVILCDMTSRWSTRVHVSVSKDEVPNANVVKLSGKFFTKVYEGPYNKFNEWINDMKAFVKQEKGIEVDPKEMYAYYATCPKCAAKYGKNYTVLFAKAD